jgi:PleD family two-component response regulator
VLSSGKPGDSLSDGGSQGEGYSTSSLSEPPSRGILVVEGDASIAHEIAQTLQRFAYPVVGFAWNGEQALQMVQRLKPALVLMNVELRGDMDGIGAAALIKANLHVPVVYLSAFASDDTVRRAMLTEPFGYLVKPWRETDLRCAIEVALTRYRSEFALPEREKLYQRLSLVDDLTHLHNRRGFQFLAEQQMKVARRENNRSLSSSST